MKFVAQLILILLTAGCAVLPAADTKPGGDVLGRWVGGKWVGSGEFVNSEYSKASKVGGVTKCDWSPDHVFVVCDQDVNFGGTPMRDLSIYAVDPKTGHFFYYSVTPQGEKPGSGTVEISSDGERWVYPGSYEKNGATIQFRTVNQFHGKDQVEWWSESSADGGKTWTRTGSGKETRGK